VQLLQPFITFALAAFFNDETITRQILLLLLPSCHRRDQVRARGLGKRRSSGVTLTTLDQPWAAASVRQRTGKSGGELDRSPGGWTV